MRDFVRPVRVMMLVLVATVGFWFALPSLASMLTKRWLERQGFQDVVVELGLAGLRSMTVPNVTLSLRLTGEVVTMSLKDSRTEYTLLGLLAGHLDLIVLTDLSVDIRISQEGRDMVRSLSEESSPDVKDSSHNVVTASDLVQRLPLLPCDELRLGRVKIFREQATGPLQTVVMTGTVKQQTGQLDVEMLLQGTDTIPYELRVIGQSAGDMSLQLRAAQPKALPIVLWRSESVRNESQVQLKGVAEVNVHELAPFIALVLPVGSEWRQVAGNVTVHWTGKAALDVPVDALWKDGRTAFQASVQVNVALPVLKGLGQDLTVKIAGTLSGNATLVHWTIAPGTLVTARVNAGKVQVLTTLRDLVPSGFQPVTIEGLKEVNGELHWTESPPRFTATGPLAVSYGFAKGQAHAEMVIAQLFGHGRDIDRLEADFHIEGSLPFAMSERVGVKSGSGDVRGTMLLKGGDLHATFLAPSSAMFTQFRQNSWSVARGTVQLSDSLAFQLDIPTGRWMAGPGRFTLRIPQIQMADRQVSIQQVTLQLAKIEGSDATWKAEAIANVSGLILKSAASQSLPMDFTIGMAADPDIVKADVHLQSQEKAVRLSAQVEHVWATGRGIVRGMLAPLTFDSAGFHLRQLQSPWPYPVDVIDGSLTVTFDGTWAEDAQHQIQMRTGSAVVLVENLAVQYRNINLTGLNTKINVAAKGQERIVISRPAEIKIASVNSGVEVTNIVMTAQGEWDLRDPLPVAEVRDFNCAVLGGTVTSQGVRADLAHPPFSFTLLVRQLDLEKMLRLEQQKGLQGSGLLDGSIPITVTSRGVTIQDGQFEARPPGGVIRYEASPEATKAVTQANANMELVLKALNNFHYNVLEVGAQYVEDGTLNLKVRLEGRNPDQKKSPPIHFNLTVQENIPALLKSLRLVQDIEESVQKKFVKP
jgi:Dicarboxylate transport